MAACADIELEIDEVSDTNSRNSTHHNVTHSENNQNDLPKKPFFQLDPNWVKENFALLFGETSNGLRCTII